MNDHLLKIPGLLLATVTLHVAYTPPNPPELSSEGVPSLVDRFLRGMIKTRTLEYIKVRINFNMVTWQIHIFYVRFVSGALH